MQHSHPRPLYIGTTAERTALAATLPADGIGVVYFDTDTQQFYSWNGSAFMLAGVSVFIGLTDVPNAYTGEGGKLVKVKATEDGLEFVAPSAGSGDVTGPAGATSDNIAIFDDATGKLLADGGKKISELEPAKGVDDNYVTDAEKIIIGNTSGTNTGDQVGDGVTITGAGTVADPFVSVAGGGDVVGPAGATDEAIVIFDTATGKLVKDSAVLLSELAVKTNVLELDNTTPFTPDADYEPSTKKYVDDNIGAATDILMTQIFS